VGDDHRRLLRRNIINLAPANNDKKTGEIIVEKIILATGNPGKVREFHDLGAGRHWEIIPQSHFNIPEAAETGLTFIENALIKARHAAQLSGLPALADDSGLMVDALDGAPGVYSARYAGEHANFSANIQKLLFAMRDVPQGQRRAHFCCALAFLRAPEDAMPIVACSLWQGEILFAPQGDNGFGYDPVFFVPTHHCSAAELASAEKNKISHRAQALQDLLNCYGKTLKLPKEKQHEK
jgi:XTP/dITP diphosphohydrolase